MNTVPDPLIVACALVARGDELTDRVRVGV